MDEKSKFSAEHELLRLRENADEHTDVHDVIVVGEHVDGDDLFHDYDDHADHHESHSAGSGKTKVKSHNEHEHEHHDESKKSLKIEHHEDKEDKTKGKKKEKGESHSDHSDHEHLLKDLSIGDVIHVEAGELEVGSI